MALEGKYRLTRKTLQVLRAHDIPCILSTKSNAPVFFEDIDLFREYGDKLTICIGQANLTHYAELAIKASCPTYEPRMSWQGWN